MRNSILDPQDLILSTECLTFVDINGHRRLKSTLLSGSDDLQDSQDSGTDMTYFLELPDDLESEFTLLYLGFNAERAHDLWQGWEALHGECLFSFIDAINDHIDTVGLTAYESQSAALEVYGLRPRTYQSIQPA